MKLVAGSYERFLWGWKVQTKEKKLELSFSYPAHLGPVKCIAACGSIVATGGSDDTIKVYDVSSQKDMGSLYQHQGAVTCLDFLKPEVSNLNRPTHMFSGSEDGTICIWDTDSWIHLKTMKSHKTAVNSLSVHHSGKVALSVEKDGHLKMWNLLNGRCTFTTRLPSEATWIKFAPQSGAAYSLIRGDKLEIYNVETGKLLHSCDNEKRVLCMAQTQDDLIFTGGEDSIIRIWDSRSGDIVMKVPKAHSNRIRGVSLLNSGHGALESGEVPQYVASASSDGSVRVWDTRIVQSLEDGAPPQPVYETSTKSRLTCLVGCGSMRKAGTAILASPGEAKAFKERGEEAADTKLLKKKRAGNGSASLKPSKKSKLSPKKVLSKAKIQVEKVSMDGRKKKKKSQKKRISS